MVNTVEKLLALNSLKKNDKSIDLHKTKLAYESIEKALQAPGLEIPVGKMCGQLSSNWALETCIILRRLQIPYQLSNSHPSKDKAHEKITIY